MKMKFKLKGGFGAVRNIVPVVDERETVVGDMHIMRRSGWRGGPTYRFHPNGHGVALGLKHTTSPSTRTLLGELAA